MVNTALASFLLILLNYINAAHVRNESVCETKFDDIFWSKMTEGGICQPYDSIQRITPGCESYLIPGVSYVYIPYSRLNGSLQRMQSFETDAINTFSFFSETCRNTALTIFCIHFYLPCGFNGTYHVPRFICPDTCAYFSETLCPIEWNFMLDLFADSVYNDDESLGLPNCSNPEQQISHLNLNADCCASGGGIQFFGESESVSLIFSVQEPSQTVTISFNDLRPSQTVTMNDLRLESSFITIVIVVAIFLLCIVIIAVPVIVLLWRNMRQMSSIGRKSGEPSMDNGTSRDEEGNLYNGISDFETDMDEVFKVKQLKQANISPSCLRKLSSSNISSSNVKLLEIIGQGEFGVVYRGLLTHADGTPLAVAVKTLKRVFSECDIEALIEESLKMKSFDHNNVLSLIGVCFQLTDAPCIVMPYMSEGSLLSYLKRERPTLTVAESVTVDEDIVRNIAKQLLSMCLQVANGMVYLSSQRFVHRDLAARNCMMSSNGVIKVADFGLTEDVYTKNYFRHTNDSNSKDSQIKLPIKWMAIESIHDGLFSEKSDVWSYGILCWEVFNVGKVPYPGLSAREVVELLDSGDRLTQPRNAACKPEIFEMILSCWKENADYRPSFTCVVSTVTKLLNPLADYMEFSDFYSAQQNSKH